VAIAAAVVGMGALESTGSAQPRSSARAVAGEAALAKQVLGARSGAARAHLASAAPSGRILGQFVGHSNLPAIATLSRDGKTLQLAIGFDMACTPSKNKFNSNDLWKVPISKKGNVSASAKFVPYQSLQGGTDKITGKFDRKHDTFTGTWDMHLIYTLQSAQGVQSTDQCDSGAVKLKLTN
jgi:hypothetical protein